MFDKQREIFREFIANPVKNNLAIVLFWSGLFLVFIGAIFGGEIDSWKYVPKGTGEASLKGGSAILGAGVFAVIMKSAQFTELFQKHIYDVFFSPAEVKDGIPLIEKWKLITNALLKEVLPSTHYEASSKIEKQFFDSELEYHFEENSNTYDIIVDSNTNIATVKSITNSTIILSPHANDPILEQYVETEGDFKLLALRLNDKNCDSNDLFVKDPNNSNRNLLSLALNDYAQARPNSDIKAIRLERVVQWTQDLKTDPYIKGAIIRYIKGAKVRARISDGYKVHFEKFGLGDMPKEYYLADDGHGYERWQLVTPDNLLLPGQGYILVIAPLTDGD